MPGPTDKGKDREAEHASFTEQYRHVAERNQATQDESGFRNAGDDETLPGQHEVEAGSVEHQQLLKSYPNATSYAPDVNVVSTPQTRGEVEEEAPPEGEDQEELARYDDESDEDYARRRDAEQREAH